MFLNSFRGFLMALADSLPGISGGTIAFIMGFYDKLIEDINKIIYTHTLKEKKESIKFIMEIGLGWVLGIVISIKILASFFEKEIYSISSLFIGFIVFYIPRLIDEEKESLSKNKKNIIFTFIGIILVYSISQWNSFYEINNISNLNYYYMYIFMSGFIAISAMILPGISGSTLLLILGVYTKIIFTLNELLSLDFSNLNLLVVFGLGILMGIITSIKILNYFIKEARDVIIYLVLGLMLGSIHSIIIGPTTLEMPMEKITMATFNIVYFFLGGVIISLLHMMNRRK